MAKHQKMFTDEIERKIISMYAEGMTTGDMETHIQDLYGVDIYDSTISRITDEILSIAKEYVLRSYKIAQHIRESARSAASMVTASAPLFTTAGKEFAPQNRVGGRRWYIARDENGKPHSPVGSAKFSGTSVPLRSTPVPENSFGLLQTALFLTSPFFFDKSTPENNENRY